MLHTTKGDQLRTVCGGGSYLSHNDSRLFWGWPADAKATGLSIHWPSGAMQEITLDGAERNLQVQEP